MEKQNKWALRISQGLLPDGREIVIITSGGHPQLSGSGDTLVEDVALLDEIPNRDVQGYFKEWKNSRRLGEK